VTNIQQPENISTSRPLLERYPALASKLPFIALGDLPTPARQLKTLGDQLDIGELWIKCDDVSAPDYGGNKIRKLEFLLADAIAQGCNTVLTFGGLGSNHALATSLNCRHLGLECVAILTPEPATDAVRRTIRYHQQLDTHIEVAKRYVDTRTIADRVIAERGANNVYEVPFGGSSWVGALGFVNAAFELSQQIDQGLLPEPDHIYVGCGTAGTTAGLALGLRLAERSIPIEAVQVTPDSIAPEALYRNLYSETIEQLCLLDSAIAPVMPVFADSRVRADQLGAGYAIPTAAAHEATQLLATTESVTASLTYTAKVMAALIADTRSGLLAGKRALFWNTFNSHPYPLLEETDNWNELPQALHFLFTD